VPMVFAGDEIGATGWWGEDSRTPFPWHDPDAWDMTTFAAYQQLLGLRRSSRALAVGGLRWLHVGTEALAFVREHPEESVLVVVARNQAEPVRVPLAELGAVGLHHEFGFTADVVADQVVIDVPSAGAGVWRVEGM
jgi:alpha-glucosidase